MRFPLIPFISFVPLIPFIPVIPFLDIVDVLDAVSLVRIRMTIAAASSRYFTEITDYTLSFSIHTNPSDTHATT